MTEKDDLLKEMFAQNGLNLGWITLEGTNISNPKALLSRWFSKLPQVAYVPFPGGYWGLSRFWVPESLDLACSKQQHRGPFGCLSLCYGLSHPYCCDGINGCGGTPWSVDQKCWSNGINSEERCHHYGPLVVLGLRDARNGEHLWDVFVCCFSVWSERSVGFRNR